MPHSKRTFIITPRASMAAGGLASSTTATTPGISASMAAASREPRRWGTVRRLRIVGISVNQATPTAQPTRVRSAISRPV